MSNTENNKTNGHGLGILILTGIVVIAFLITAGLFYKTCSCEVNCHCSCLACIVLGGFLIIIITLLVVYTKLTNDNIALLEAEAYKARLEKAIELAQKQGDQKAMLAIINTLIQSN